MRRTEFPKLATVKYADFRKHIRTGDLLMCSGTSWVSRIIQRVTDSVWSHVAVVVRVHSIDRIVVIESVETIGVRAVALSKYLTDYNGSGCGYPGGVVVARHRDAIQCTDDDRRRGGQWLADRLGYPYDAGEIVKILARIINSVTVLIPWTVDEQHELLPDREYICAEYAMGYLTAMKLKVEPDILGFISPANFASDPRIKLVAVLKRL